MSMVGGWDAAANKAELLPRVAGIPEGGRQVVNRRIFRGDEGSEQRSGGQGARDQPAP